MSKKFILLAALFIAVSISGCISDRGTDTNQTIKSDSIPQTNLPAGFVYMGIHEAAVDIGGSLTNATEGVYKYNNKDDVYIQIIENDKPDALITQYRLRYKDANYDPFKEVSLNGHNATQITDYSTIDGKQVPYYSIMWSSKKSMIIVGSSSNAQAVIDLAIATGR